jgi:1-acyl-sn-glycerol-3-phosphate acyltransferase
MNLFFVGSLVILAAILAYLIPSANGRHWFRKKVVMPLPLVWGFFNSAIMGISNYGKISITGPKLQDREGFYLLFANHRSWADILLVCKVLGFRFPPFKFFLKRELLWTLPVGGLVCWFLGFPLLRRHAKEQVRKNPELKGVDIETTKRACEKLGKFPCTLINFLEGTRFTKEKYERQRSPYQYLLKPKSTGVAICCNELRGKVQNIINLTIVYEDEFSIWDFLSGSTKKINIHYSIIPITEDYYGDYFNDREFRRNFQQLLNDLWLQKDLLIKKIKQGEVECE